MRRPNSKIAPPITQSLENLAAPKAPLEPFLWRRHSDGQRVSISAFYLALSRLKFLPGFCRTPGGGVLCFLSILFLCVCLCGVCGPNGTRVALLPASVQVLDGRSRTSLREWYECLLLLVLALENSPHVIVFFFHLFFSFCSTVKEGRSLGLTGMSSPLPHVFVHLFDLSFLLLHEQLASHL